jgi:hypothetical protein
MKVRLNTRSWGTKGIQCHARTSSHCTDSSPPQQRKINGDSIQLILISSLQLHKVTQYWNYQMMEEWMPVTLTVRQRPSRAFTMVVNGDIPDQLKSFLYPTYIVSLEKKTPTPVQTIIWGTLIIQWYWPIVADLITSFSPSSSSGKKKDPNASLDHHLRNPHHPIILTPFLQAEAVGQGQFARTEEHITPYLKWLCLYPTL